jgi:hypothetical protein
MKWTKEEEHFLAINYPEKGRLWCATHLNRSAAQVRSKTARMKIYQDTESGFFKEWQKRAAASKIGKKQSIESRISRSVQDKADFASGKRTIKRSTRKRMSIAMKKRIALKGHNRGMLGKKHSPENKAKFSVIAKDRWARMTDEQKMEKTKKMIYTKIKSGTYAPQRHKCTWKAGWREFGGKRCYYRSLWEANYGRYLEFLKSIGDIVEWEHEPDVFWFEGVKRGCVSYLPDFKVTSLDGSISYHEVKGWMDANSKTKLKRMAKYYPNIKLILIRQKEYNEIKSKLAKMILGWE